jgi:tetratricopeptide (TPR) repeat protein
MRKWLIPIAVLVITSSVSRPALAQFDKIFDDRGRARNGSIVKMTPTTITLNESGSDVLFKINAIRGLQFGDEPAELTTARDRVRQSNLEGALEELKKVNVNAITRDVVKQDAQFYTAFVEGKLALAGTGDKAAAKDKMLNFIKDAPGSYHLFTGAELLGDLAMALEQFEDAGRYYNALTKAEAPETKLKADVLIARALLGQQNYSGALDKFNAVIASPADSPEAGRQKLFGQIGRAICLAETGKADEGIRIIDDIIAKNDPRDAELFGRAYNAKGRCYLKGDKKDDALLAYLHTDLMFNKVPDVHAESLYYLTRLWGDVQQAERAVKARTFLNEYYSGSPWAKRQ